MKKAFDIRSIRSDRNGKGGYLYCPIGQNAKFIYKLLERHSLRCVGMKQWNDDWWEIRLKGKHKNIEAFIFEFSCGAGTLYTIKETYW